MQDFSFFFELSGDLLATINTDSIICSVNQSFCNKLGYSKEELINKKLPDYFNKTNRNSFAKKIQGLINSKSQIQFENQIICKNTDLKQLKWLLSYNSQDDLIYIIAKEQTVKNIKKQLKKRIQEAAKIGGWEYDIKTNQTFWTEGIYSIYGIEKNVKTNLEIGINQYVKEDQQAVIDSLQWCIKEKLPYEIRVRFKKSNGDIIWVRVKADPVLDERGEVTAVQGIFQDINDDEITKLDLQSNQEILKSLIKYTPASIAMFDKDMKYLEHSNRWLIDYKLTGQSLIGKSHYEVFPDILDRWKEDHRKVQNGITLSNSEDQWIREDGSIVYVNWALRPWFKTNGENGGIIMFTQVITEEVLVKKELENTVKELTKSNLDLEQFAYAASHDLQEPLRMIGNFTELIKIKYSEKLDGNGIKYLDMCLSNCIRMKNLINNLLDYSRVGRKESKIKKVNFTKLINDQIEQLTLLIEEKKAKITIGNFPETIHCVGSQIGIVLFNLISNSLKFNNNIPEIKLTYGEDSNYHLISVKDNGIGFDTKHIERIFLAFQKLHPKEAYEGTGIGLALCKKIVERHEGSFKVDSSEKGSNFTFSILKKLM